MTGFDVTGILVIKGYKSLSDDHCLSGTDSTFYIILLVFYKIRYYQRFSDIFRGIKKEHGEEMGYVCDEISQFQ